MLADDFFPPTSALIIFVLGELTARFTFRLLSTFVLVDELCLVLKFIKVLLHSEDEQAKF